MDNLESWIAKGEVIQRTGLDERTIERKVKRGEIRREYRPLPGRKPLPVYHPEDVEKLLVRTLTPVALKTPALYRRKPTHPDAPVFIPVEHKFFLSLKEASALSGLPESYLRRRVRSGSLQAAKVGGWRIKRAHLEEMSIDIE